MQSAVSGATILVTNHVHRGGAGDDGLLGVYKIRTDPMEFQKTETTPAHGNGTEAVRK